LLLLSLLLLCLAEVTDTIKQGQASKLRQMSIYKEHFRMDSTGERPKRFIVPLSSLADPGVYGTRSLAKEEEPERASLEESIMQNPLQLVR
jgi:hypothetical protein